MQRLLPAIFGAFFVVYVATAIISGSASYVLAVVLVVLFVFVAVALTGLGRRRLEQRHGGDREAAMSDHTDPVPSAPFITDDETALGDTTEAHDEISPHDLPKHHPGRAAAEAQAARQTAGSGVGTTQGDR